jgi:formylglycine-generating enzyme required for sulfatase activity
MSRKIALLIGVSNYGDRPDPLRCTAKGVKAMRAVLSDPNIGEFDEVTPLFDPDLATMQRNIASTFNQAKKDDLVLLYFTGHGIKDMTGAFYLTTAQTEIFKSGEINAGTAVEASFIQRMIGNCCAERKVVILDCCFAGAFVEGFLGMDDGSVDVAEQLGVQALGDKGYCVLTAATSTRYALEPKSEDEELSVYTRYLVEGLKTGGAAPDGELFISLRHWHEYVKAQVAVAASTMKPDFKSVHDGYGIIIAKAHVDNEQRYRKQVQKKVQAGCGYLRPGAVANLRQWQRRLFISDDQAAAILAEVLKPYQEKARNIKEYAAILIAEIAEAAKAKYAYLLEPEGIEQLQELKQQLNLRDEDVHITEKQLLSGQVLSQIEDQIQSASVIPQNPIFSFETVRVNGADEVVEAIPDQMECFAEDLGNDIKLEMVQIPGGKFLMGAAKGEEGASDDEYPQHEVTVPEFWMGRFAVTQAQWQAVAALNKIDQDLKGDPARFKGANRPVEQVSWDDAVEFCKRLSQKSQREYRLPSEAQWEYACRAGTTTPFHFGPTLTPELANCNGDKKGTTDVGSFNPNAFGLYDMHGNVWEWCLDGWNNSYEGAPTDGSIWESTNEGKVLRGGSWSSYPALCRAAPTPSVFVFVVLCPGLSVTLFSFTLFPSTLLSYLARSAQKFF